MEGKTAAICAEIIGKQFGWILTRNSICGKASRMGLPHHVKRYNVKSPDPIPYKPRKDNTHLAKSRKLKGGNNFAFPRSCSFAKIAEPENLIKELPPDQSEYAVPFLGRTMDKCCYPLWRGDEPIHQKFVCGAKVEVGSYCQRHAKTTFSYSPRRAY